MAETILRGPSVDLCSLMDGTIDPFDGPGIAYQASVFPDPRFTPAKKDGLLPGRIPSFLNSPYVVMCDNIPTAAATGRLAANQAGTSALAIALVTSQVTSPASGQPTICVGLPLIPFGTTVATTVIALEFGFTTGTTTTNSSSVVVADSTLFTLGQWIVIAGAGNGSASAPLFTQVVGITAATTTLISISPVAATGLGPVPIGQGNLFGNLTAIQAGQSIASANGPAPYRVGGIASIFDPVQALTRNLTITGATSGSALMTGFDIYGNLMTELITGNGTTAVGKKAFKYLLKGVPGANVAGIGIGVGDVFGINLRSDKYEYLDVFWNGSFMTTAGTAYTSAVLSTATNTTGDTRGTINVAAISGTGSNGTGRLAIMGTISLISLLNATPIASTSMFGVAQSVT